MISPTSGSTPAPLELVSATGADARPRPQPEPATNPVVRNDSVEISTRARNLLAGSSGAPGG